jgi:hypothetical protein
MIDGSITISTKIDQSGMHEGISKIRKSLFGASGAAQSSAKKMSAAYISARAKVEELEAALDALDAKRDAIAYEKMAAVSGLPYTRDEMYAAVEETLRGDKAYQKLSASIENTETKLSGYKIKMQLASEAMTRGSSAASKARFNFKKLKGDAIPLTKSILSVANMFKLLALRMILRGVINSIRRGFQDLAKNSTVFNSTMSELSTAFLQVRNSLASAFAPALQALTPIILTVTNAFINAMNAVAAFNSRLFGSKATYIQAKKAQVDYAKSLENTNDAMKGQVAGFDKLNVLDSDDSGAESAGPSAGDMFEEVPIPDKILTFADNIKANLDTIRDAAIAVGVAFLTWKIGSALGLGLLNTLGLVLAVGGAVIFIKSLFDMWNNGVDWDNLTTTLISLGAVVLGFTIILGPVAGVIALLIGAIAMIVVGIRDWIKTGELSIQTLGLLQIAIIAVGVALWFLSANPIVLIIAAIVALILAIVYLVQNWDEVKEKAIETWEKIKAAWQKVKDWFKEHVIDPLANFFRGLWDGIKGAATSLANWVKEKVVDPIVDAFKWFYNKVASILEGIINGFIGIINGFIRGINKVIDTINKIPGVNLGMLGQMSQVYIPRMAKGGIVTAPTVAQIGERGREAVLPLENNTGWMDVFANKIADKVSVAVAGAGGGDIYVYLDSDQISAAVERRATRKALRTNGR